MKIKEGRKEMRTKATVQKRNYWVDVVSNCTMGLFWGERIVTQFPAQPRNENIPIVLFDTKPTQSHMQPRNSQYRHTHLSYCFRSPGHNSVSVKNPGKHAA